MARTTKPGAGGTADRPAAQSVDREPTGEPTPQEQGLPVGREDTPRGLPTTDRFETEQAHRRHETKVPKP